jgi:hypothetical protein
MIDNGVDWYDYENHGTDKTYDTLLDLETNSEASREGVEGGSKETMGINTACRVVCGRANEKLNSNLCSQNLEEMGAYSQVVIQDV